MRFATPSSWMDLAPSTPAGSLLVALRSSSPKGQTARACACLRRATRRQYSANGANETVSLRPGTGGQFQAYAGTMIAKAGLAESPEQDHEGDSFRIFHPDHVFGL